MPELREEKVKVAKLGFDGCSSGLRGVGPHALAKALRTFARRTSLSRSRGTHSFTLGGVNEVDLVDV